MTTLVAIALVSCDGPTDAGAPDAERFEPSLTGSAHVPYSTSETVALLDEHTACTIDTYETKIDCVDSSGATVGRFGDKGEGPGEFLSPARVIRGPDGLIGFSDSSRRRFFVFTREGELVAEVPLHMLSIFVPISFSETTVLGAYTDGVGRAFFSAYMGDVMAAAEISLSTGDVVREWKPASVPEFPECEHGLPYYGFPAVGGAGDDTWVFMGCGPGGDTTMLRAPRYVAESPSDRDVEEYGDGLREFRRRIGADPDVSASVREFSETPRLYFLLRGQETFDGQGRLWISTRRGRMESSFIDVYDGVELVGTVEVRDRMIDFDLFDGTLAVLVERQVGPDDSDGVPDRGIDWYDLGEF
ncbi:MAG: hypothetical protein F4187_04920 [Gemmatimonadetes bacterium]|nr:hypothetical protein [Gemmatimonadota bacterium]